MAQKSAIILALKGDNFAPLATLLIEKALPFLFFKSIFLGMNEVVEAKVQGITPEFIEIARKHGFQNLSLDKLIQLKQLGILESKGEI